MGQEPNHEEHLRLQVQKRSTNMITTRTVSNQSDKMITSKSNVGVTTVHKDKVIIYVLC